MFGLSKYIVIGLGAALAISAAGNWFLFNQNGQLHSNIATEKANVALARGELTDATATINRMTAHQENQQKELQEIYAANTQIETERDDAIATLNTYRGRIQVVALARPTLLGRMASRASARVFYDIFIASGGKEDETPDDIPPVTSETDPLD